MIMIDSEPAKSAEVLWEMKKELDHQKEQNNEQDRKNSV
jgi:hypothetical protein